jgi:hypothetical protein
VPEAGNISAPEFHYSPIRLQPWQSPSKKGHRCPLPLYFPAFFAAFRNLYPAP